MEEQLCCDAGTDPRASCDAAAAEVTLNWPDWPDWTLIPAALTQRAGITALTENFRELRALSGNKGWARLLVWFSLKWPLWAVPIITEAVTAPKYSTGMAAFHILRIQNTSTVMSTNWSLNNKTGWESQQNTLLKRAWSAGHRNQPASVDWTGPDYHASNSVLEIHLVYITKQ